MSRLLGSGDLITKPYPAQIAVRLARKSYAWRLLFVVVGSYRVIAFRRVCTLVVIMQVPICTMHLFLSNFPRPVEEKVDHAQSWRDFRYFARHPECQRLYHNGMSDFPAKASSETCPSPEKHVGDQGQRRGESSETSGPIGSECVTRSGWSDCPVALSYSSGANHLVSSDAGDEHSSHGLVQPVLPSRACESLLIHRFHQSMDCGGSWRGFRGVNGGE